MNHIVFMSGGAGSYCAAKRVIERHGKQDVILLFQDVLIEDADLYDFLNKAESFLDVPITRISDGRTPWQVYKDTRMLGGAFQDPCSRILKRELATKWIKKHYGPDECHLYVGIDVWEAQRMNAIQGRWAPYQVSSPLLEKPYVLKADMLKIIEQDGLGTQRLYKLGLEHSNCGGWCIKAGQKQYRILLEKWPERFKEFEQKEQEIADHIGKKVTVLSQKINGQKVPMSLKEFREKAEQKTAGLLHIDFEDVVNSSDQDGCACMSI